MGQDPRVPVLPHQDGAGDSSGQGCHGDGGRDADEEQKRRHQEAATNAEHTRQDTDQPAQPQQKEGVDGYLGDRKVYQHEAP